MTLRQRHITVLFLSALLLPAGLVSCSKADRRTVSSEEAETKPVDLAISLRSGSSTKASLDVITEMQSTPDFRGLSSLKVVPFESESAVTGSDKTLSNILELPSVGKSGFSTVSYAHNFTGLGLNLPLKMASALVYGRAPWTNSQTVEQLHIDGSLREIGFEKKGEKAYVAHAAELGFEPHTMLVPGSGAPQEAHDIAEVLTNIVIGDAFTIKAFYDDNSKSIDVIMPWDGSIGDENLRTCYEDITVEGALMPGSGENVEALLTNLYRSLYNYNIINPHAYEVQKDGEVYQDVKKKDQNGNYSPLTYADIYKGVRDMILARIVEQTPDEAEERDGIIEITDGADGDKEVHFISSDHADYPTQYGLPSGAAVVRWTPSEYVVPLEHGLDGIAPISYFCYPPALYYFSNTTIRTSNEEAEPGQDTQTTSAYNPNYSWEEIVAMYQDGKAVSHNTRAVVLETPLEYAVGMLSATVRAEKEFLQDNDGRDDTGVYATGENLPLTGVIIGRQYPTYFDFTPKYEGDVESQQYYLYDNQIPEGIYLHVQGKDETLKEFRTLVLETPRKTNEWNTEVYFALEFLNNTDPFEGAEGRILHGHKFYLVGKLGFPEETEFDRVFIRDCITSAPCVIKTLKNAHNAVPDLGVPQLALGVELESNWVMSTPVTMILGDDDSAEE